MKSTNVFVQHFLSIAKFPYIVGGSFALCQIMIHHLTLALGMEDVHGPADVINGTPLNVATPLSSV